MAVRGIALVSAILDETVESSLSNLLTFLQLAVDGLRTVSSGLLGLGLGDSQELKKDWMKGSRFCPFWNQDSRDVSGRADGSWWTTLAHLLDQLPWNGLEDLSCETTEDNGASLRSNPPGRES